MHETASGQWIVIQPYEIMATFLIPLPDPLPVADLTTLPSLLSLETATINVLEPWISILGLQRLDEPGLSDLSDMLSVVSTSGVVNWANKKVLECSILFHQVFDDAGFRVGLEPAMRLAELVSRGESVALRDQRFEQANNAGTYFEPTPLRERGVGAMTVAECVVGLRIVADVPDVQSPREIHSAPQPPFGPLESDHLFPDALDMWQWRVARPGSPVGADLLDRRLHNALAIALRNIRSIQRAVQLIRRSPQVLSSLERLPLVVPVVLRHAASLGTESQPSPVVLLETGSRAATVAAPTPLSETEMRSLNIARRRMEGGAFAGHADVHREGHVALERLGDYRLAALLFGISAESLLDELILHLMWEEGLTPEQVALNWQVGLERRVSLELPGRLHGSWDRTASNAIGHWHKHVAALRHRVAHAAYTPTKEEAVQSFESINALVTEVCDRLAAPRVRNRYPRTALALAGETGLRMRNAFTRRVRDVQQGTSEVPWVETFLRWREAWRRVHQDLSGKPRVPDSEGAFLLAVLHTDGSVHWCRHDRQQHLATEVTVPADALTQSVLDKLAEIGGGHERLPGPLSVGCEARLRTAYPRGATWTEEYHHVPMTQVMVDSSDFRRPIEYGIDHP